jgi:hypothetical protein
MQYYKPDAPHLFVGDCMPFYHDRVFHLYYLLDEGHHQALGGLGGHQWAHASTTDLVTWTHHPLALALTEADEVSICTGSVFFHAGTYYAFHAVRRPDRTQRLGVATGTDGIAFRKQPAPPHAEPPPGYNPLHYRDPCVFRDPDSGRFHMLVTAAQADYAVPGYGACLAHLVSDDLTQWENAAPFLIPGFPDPPECPDHFHWNGWYYLVFSNGLQARYRMARRPLGPWLRPAQDLLDGPWGRVMKTAAYHDNRRIGVAWLGTRVGDTDTGRLQWGGHAVFRELVQHADGALGTRFVPEMTLPVGPALDLAAQAVTPDAAATPGRIVLDSAAGLAVAQLTGLPQNAHITLTAIPAPNTRRYGLRLRAAGVFEQGYLLDLLPDARRVDLCDAALVPVDGLDRPLTLEIILKDDILDVCIDRRRCLINRGPEQRGDCIIFYCQNGAVTFDQIQVRPLL